MGRVPVNMRRGHFNPGHYRKSAPEDAAFSWIDVPKTIWMFLDRDKGKFVFFNILLFMVFFYELVPPFIVGKVVDFFTHYHSGDSLQLFYFYLLFLAVSYALIALIRLYSKNVMSKTGIAVRSRAKIKGFGRLMDASIEWHMEESTGNKVQRILTGSQGLFELIKIGSGNVYLIITNFVGVSLFFLFTNWVFFLFSIVYTLIFCIILFSFNKKMEALGLAYDQALEKSSGSYVEGTSNILSIKAVGAEKRLHSRFEAQEMSVKEFQFALADTNNKKWRFFQIWNGCAYGILLFLIGQQVMAGAISVGLILVLYTYFNKLRDAANDTNDIGTALIGFKVDVGRMMPIFREKPIVRSGDKLFPKDWDAITIKDADFFYSNGQKGLSKFDLVIPRGARIGVAGVSGSGKSTLVKIMLGLYELKSGQFRIGDTDFYDISHEEVTNNIAVVLQETELFNLSLRENITMMRDFDQELFNHAVDVADLKEVIARLPEGLDTVIGERGYSLSGGERQRIGIARAIYKDCPIILLDEATSALDSRTEKNIVDRLLGNSAEDKTFIIIAHRLSTLRNADEIIVIDRGTIAEQGRFGQLIKRRNSKLGALYASQK